MFKDFISATNLIEKSIFLFILPMHIRLIFSLGKCNGFWEKYQYLRFFHITALLGNNSYKNIQITYASPFPSLWKSGITPCAIRDGCLSWTYVKINPYGKFI